jgi:hypothetical protein
MVAKGWKYFCGVGERPMINLPPMIRGTKEIWDPPRLNLKIEPNGISNYAHPHQPLPAPPIRDGEQ